MKPIPLKTAAKLSITFSILGILLLTIGICIGTNVGLIVLIIGLIVLLGTIIFIGLFIDAHIVKVFSLYRIVAIIVLIVENI